MDFYKYQFTCTRLPDSELAFVNHTNCWSMRGSIPGHVALNAYKKPSYPGSLVSALIPNSKIEFVIRPILITVCNE